MKMVDRKSAISLGIRVGSMFLVTVVVVILGAYYVSSQNFQKMMTDYTIKLVESMADQGVKLVETELAIGREEISLLANSFQVPDSEEAPVEFPQPYASGEYLRMVYVTEDSLVASDGRQREIRERQDIRIAYEGKNSVYGPYFNEENEYVICYSAPVIRDGNIVGVLSLEKDGYQLCNLIEEIRFVDTGESYIINAEGTDIAVSDQNHIEWVNSQYNAKKLLKENPDEETRSIVELEQKGLNGESGVGTYYWEDGLVYVIYRPIPSTEWVLLAGLREEEIVSMTQSALFATASNVPMLSICLLSIISLTILIAYWIISSMKKNAEINEKLNVIANHDALTGLMNRNSYHDALNALLKRDGRTFGCVYVDINGLHEVNNQQGHQAGDKMLKAVAEELLGAFVKDKLYRIGGDEFVVLCRDRSEDEIYCAAETVKEKLSEQNYEISVGVAWQEHNGDVEKVINDAEAKMQQDKELFYRRNGNERRMRN